MQKLRKAAFISYDANLSRGIAAGIAAVPDATASAIAATGKFRARRKALKGGRDAFAHGFIDPA
jgi:hypothetical protein